MQKKKNASKFDLLVERLINEFMKIPNFDLTAKDEAANKIFNIVTFRMAEIHSYKELVCQQFIPAVNKAIAESKADFQHSRYKYLLQTEELDFNETLYDTIRLAYVGLFHKLENYINDVIKVTELIFAGLYQTEGSVAKWAKEKFNFEIKDWQQFAISYKINWICNCVKHKDGLPVKIPRPFAFRNSDETQRLRLTPKEFKQDCELLIQFYPLYLQTMFMFAQHKLAAEIDINPEDYKNSPDLYEKQLQLKDELESKVSQFMDLLKLMGEQ